MKEDTKLNIGECHHHCTILAILPIHCKFLFLFVGCKGELGILMDESGSIKDPDFQKQKDFIIDLANGFTNFGPNGIQMAIISYSTNANLDIKLNQYSNKMQFISAVRKIKQFSKWMILSCLR